jgi:hypothetical protein
MAGDSVTAMVDIFVKCSGNRSDWACQCSYHRGTETMVSFTRFKLVYCENFKLPKVFVTRNEINTGSFWDVDQIISKYVTDGF